MPETNSARSFQKPLEKSIEAATISSPTSGKTSGASDDVEKKKESARGTVSSGKRGMSSIQPAERNYNGLEALVRKFPAGRPLTDVEGFDEFSKQWYCFFLPIVMLTFLMALVNIGVGLLLIAFGMHPMVAYRNVFANWIIGLEIVACFFTGGYALVNLFVIQRTLVASYAFMQAIATIILFVGSICLLLVYEFANDLPPPTSNSTTAVSATITAAPLTTTESSLAGPGSIMPVMIFSFIAFFVQIAKLVVAYRYRLYLIIKRYAQKSVTEN